MFLSIDGGRFQISSSGTSQGDNHRRFLALMVGALGSRRRCFLAFMMCALRSVAPAPPRGPAIDVS
jgi:hypothetical protein